MNDVIYEPKGKAREYAALACNPYNGCTHGCKYCYCARFKKEQYFQSASPKKDFIKRLTKDAHRLRGVNLCAESPEILISFQGDPYQPEEEIFRLTRETIKILNEENLPFTILTKGGMRAFADFDLLKESSKARLGTSLVFSNRDDQRRWEPNAADYVGRISAIEQAKAMGIRTWVSLEPVIDPRQSLRIIRDLHEIVDFWRIGKINHDKILEQAVDWRAFKNDAAELLEKHDATYLFKDSLQHY